MCLLNSSVLFQLVITANHTMFQSYTASVTTTDVREKNSDPKLRKQLRKQLDVG